MKTYRVPTFGAGFIDDATGRPILFSAPMILALLAGRKTQTRRLAWYDNKKTDEFYVEKARASPWQRVQPGDRLWVRENLKRPAQLWYYSADNAKLLVPSLSSAPAVKWSDSRTQDYAPSIHMPRWASRLTLIVTGTKIERLQSISESDAAAEGWTRHPEFGSDPEIHRDAARDWYSDLWIDLHGVESWKANQEVCAVTFKVIRANIDAPEARAA